MINVPMIFSTHMPWDVSSYVCVEVHLINEEQIEKCTNEQHIINEMSILLFIVLGS